MLRPDRLTLKAREAVQGAMEQARTRGNPVVNDAHLLSALLAQDEGIVQPLLTKAGVSIPRLGNRVESEIASFPTQRGEVDLMPTILDWLELEPPRSCDGRSLLPFLEGEQPANWRTEAHFEHDFRDIPLQGPETAFGLHSDDCNYAVIRGERYKYVHFAALPALLFDMVDDPGETRNLADDPAHRGIVADCAQKMLSWRLRHADRTLTGMHLTSNGVVSRR